MRVVLATGNYPPDIGGHAFLIPHLARRLVDREAVVTVLTYSEEPSQETEDEDSSAPYRVVRVLRSGTSIRRWSRYSSAVMSVATDADVILAFSLVSTGIPIAFARLTRPGKVLRLGGDFFWERYTDGGGELSLRDWMASRHWTRIGSHLFTKMLLASFDPLVYTTGFQRDLHEKRFKNLLDTSVLEHGFPTESQPQAALKERPEHPPFRLLFIGRLVRCKNLVHLFHALCHLPDVHLTVAGSGPLRMELERLRRTLGLESRVEFTQPVGAKGKSRLFESQHLLMLPSLTDVSPRVALEARVAGLPVLLSRETGLSDRVTEGMMLRKLDTPANIQTAIEQVRGDYDRFVADAAHPQVVRTLEDECDDWYAVLEAAARGG